MGWFGDRTTLIQALKDAGADHDENGNFPIAGSTGHGLDPGEVLIGDDAMYHVNREPHSLVELMASRGDGVCVTIF